MGIPLDQQAVIFNRFAQVDQAKSREFEGAGLGLAISKELIELMHGTIGVESEEGKGSSFWFEIPLQLADHNSEH